MKNRQRFATIPVLIVLLGAGGCHKAASNASAGQVFSHVDAATAGSIEGVVYFDKPAPKRVEIDMAQDPACAMTGGTNYSEAYVVNDGKLANVYVYVKDGLGNKVYPVAASSVVLDQKGCRYVPHVIAAQVGQQIEFRNSDNTMHNVHMEPVVEDGSGNKAFDISQPPHGGTTEHSFDKAETMMTVRCNNHPWMEAYINVAPNPFFSVSDGAGHFSITGLPPGTYTLSAIQEKLGSHEATVTVSSHATAKTEFHFSTP